MTKKRIHLIYSILVSLSAVVAGICLIVSCVQLYSFQSGSFSRESVAAAFSPIAVPVYICLALVIGGFVLDIFFPEEVRKLPVQKQYGTILENLQKKVDITKCDQKLCKAILQQQRARRIHSLISIALLGVCSGIFFFYTLRGENYPEDANRAVVQAMWVFLPCLAVPFGYAVFTAYYKNHSLRKEIELVKAAIAAGAVAEKTPSAPAVQKQTVTLIFRYAILGIAVAVLVGGFIFGGTADVLAKAAAICTECVGLG